MRKNIIWLACVILAALIQTTWLDAIRIQGVLPDLIVLFVVYFALSENEERAMFTGLVGGMFQDIAGDVVLGHHILCLVVIGYAAGRMSTRLVTEHPAVKVGLVFCATLAHGLLFTATAYLQRPAPGALTLIASSVIPGAFYTALLTPIVFYVLGRIFRPPTTEEGIAR